VRLLEQRGHDLSMQVGLIFSGCAECRLEEVDRRHRLARPLDVGSAEVSIRVGTATCRIPTLARSGSAVVA
jgi:hypothetical protein